MLVPRVYLFARRTIRQGCDAAASPTCPCQQTPWHEDQPIFTPWRLCCVASFARRPVAQDRLAALWQLSAVSPQPSPHLSFTRSAARGIAACCRVLPGRRVERDRRMRAARRCGWDWWISAQPAGRGVGRSSPVVRMAAGGESCRQAAPGRAFRARSHGRCSPAAWAGPSNVRHRHLFHPAKPKSGAILQDRLGKGCHHPSRLAATGPEPTQEKRSGARKADLPPASRTPGSLPPTPMGSRGFLPSYWSAPWPHLLPILRSTFHQMFPPVPRCWPRGCTVSAGRR